MATEELKLKIVVDTSAISGGVNQAKKKLEGIEKGTNGTQNSAKQAKQEFEKLRGVVRDIGSLKFGDIIINNLENISKICGRVKTNFKSFASDVRELFGYFRLDWKKFGFKEAFKDFKEYTVPQLADSAKTSIGDSVQALGDGVSQMLGKAEEGAEGAGQAANEASMAIALCVALITALIAAITAMIKNALNVSKLVRETYMLAQKAGMATDTYQEWGYVLQYCGIEASELSEIISTLTESQIDVIAGTEEMIQAFNALGISQDEVMESSQDELFQKTIKRLQQIEDKTQRAAIAYKVFGEDAKKLTTVLNLSNEDTKNLISNYNALGATMGGNLIEKSNGLQTAILNLKMAWQGFKNILAEALIPAIQDFVEWLTTALVWINALAKVLFGFGGGNAEKATLKSTKGMNQYKDSIKATTGAVNELKRTTMGFDELNIVSNPKASGGGGSSSTGYFGNYNAADLSSMFNFNSEYLDIQEKVNKYKTQIQDIATYGLLGIGILLAVIGLFTGGIVSPAFLLGCSLAGIGIRVGMTEGSSFERLSEAASKWWKEFKPWLEKNVFVIFTKKFWEEKWKAIGEGARTKLEEVKTVVSEKWEALKSWVATNIPIFTKEYWEKKWDSLPQATKTKIEDTKKAIEEKWEAIKSWWNTNIAPKFTKSYWEGKFDSIKQGFRSKMDDTKKSIEEKWSGIKSWWDTNVAPKFTFTYWKEKFSTIRDGAAQAIEDAKLAIQEKWKGVKDWFDTNVAPKFTITYWTEKFNTIKNGAKAAFNGIITVIETAINNIIKKLNTISWQIPSYVPTYGGKTFGFNLSTVSIPRLATGGITNGSVLANIGENGREAVLPLENNTGWMDILADRIAARSSQRVVLQVGEKELGWATIGAINGITKQTGGLQLAL